jgi:VIT1/CCC1 family predicted Fe2+/Mn2+ transporter
VPDPRDIRRFREHLIDEQDGAAMYRALAELAASPEIAEVYRKMAAVEDRHGEVWREKLRAAHAPLPGPRPGWRTRVLIAFARRMGPEWILPTLTEREKADGARYGTGGAGSAAMARDEGSHARVLSALAESGRGFAGSGLAKLEGRHRAVAGNALRAAVLGANDGLVSNLSLVMGVAGAELSGSSILVTGFAGLLAGAGSMALGEWLSVQSSRELYQHQIELEREELAAHPEEEVEELTLIYQARGLDTAAARAMAERQVADPGQALEALAREELGVDPQELGGSAWVAAGASFALFALGAILPVLPFLGLAGDRAVLASLGLSGIGLFGIGAAITLMTGKNAWFSGLRQLAFGLGAAGLTWGIGHLIGVSLAG